MKIIYNEVRVDDVLDDILKEYLDKDCVSVINDYLGNDCIRIDVKIKYKKEKYEYSRKPYLNGWIKSYNNFSDFQKKHCKKIIKHLFKNKNTPFNRKMLMEVSGICGYGSLCDLVYLMISCGLVRYTFKSYKFDTNETQWSNRYNRQVIKYRYYKVKNIYLFMDK